MSRSGQPDRGGSALGERPRGQGFSSADLEFDKDVLCVFPRLHLAGAFHLTDFHLFGFYPSPIRTLIAREFSSIFRHSHKFFTFKLVTRSKCSPFSINFHLALVQPNLNSPDKSDFFLANLANYPQRFSFVTKLTRCSAPARAHAMVMNEWARAGCSSRVAREKWKSGENSHSLSLSLSAQGATQSTSVPQTSGCKHTACHFSYGTCEYENNPLMREGKWVALQCTQTQTRAGKG